tara:strand:- start:8688 stop:9929 length:1242 start_codon:yes stop_codon:yes gene_type:complete
MEIIMRNNKRGIMSFNHLRDSCNVTHNKNMKYIIAAIICSLPILAVADHVYLKDGSQLVGQIQKMSDTKLTMDTSFAKGLEIQSNTIKGVATDNKLMVGLKSGDRLNGILMYSEETGQRLVKTSFGDIQLQGGSELANIWRKETDSPEIAVETQQHKQTVAKLEAQHKEELEHVKQSYEEKIGDIETAKAKLEDPWSGNIGLGVSGQSGNTDNFGVQGRGEAVRDTGFDRITLYVEGNLEKQNKTTSTNEVFAGAALEHDLNPVWFVFGSADFEKDEFENLELRGIAQTGLGRFFIRQDNLILKGLVGLGYQHESFTDGTTSEEGVVSLGTDFLYQYDEWWKFGHKFTYYPSLSRPASDYRLISNAFAELPLAGIDSPWKLRLSLRNQYDNVPKPSINKLDTTYMMNLVYDWE